ncbi:MAG: methyl-accepting chemotaxis protein [Steroidobacteraceae bacterium]
MNWIRNLPFPVKLGAITAVMLVPVLLLGFFFTKTENDTIRLSQNIDAGLHYYHEMEEMLLPLGEREAYSVARALGDSSAGAKVDAATAEIDAVIEMQDKVPMEFDGDTAEAARRWDKIKSDWQRLKTTRSQLPSEISSAHDEVRNQVMDFISWIATTSGIALDPGAVSYFVLDNAALRVPQLEAALADVRAGAARIAAQGSSTEAERISLAREMAHVQVAMEAIESNVSSATRGGEDGARVEAETRAALASLKEGTREYIEFVEKKVTAGGVAVTAVMDSGSRLPSLIDTVHDSMQKTGLDLVNARIDAEVLKRNEVLAIVGIALLAALAFAWIVARTTIQRLRHGVEVVSRMADGDYTAEIDANPGRDEIGRVLLALRTTRDRLSKVLAGVKASAETVATAAKEINEGTHDLAGRTEQAAANLEETASSMEEITSTVKQTADNAALANQLAQTSRQQAEQGGTVAHSTSEAMSAIEESSRKIADIIGVIDEIAFQTNLLALNAAVEAARAGDQGRGFAVVASEVRTLAQRSASAAKEIKSLIETSVDRVTEGSRLVADSGKTLEAIVESVKKVSDVVGEISAAGREQAEGVEEVNRSIMQMDEGTQQNAAMVEQATAAAASMSEQAGKLRELTAIFKIRADFAAAGDVQQGGASSSGAASAGASATPKATPVARPAAKPLAARKPLAERRGSNRPWSKESKPAGSEAEGAKAAPAPRRAASGGEDWEQF